MSERRGAVTRSRPAVAQTKKPPLRDLMGSDSDKPKMSFGWLVLGMGYGILAGHLTAVFFVIPPDSMSEYGRTLLMALVVGALVGICGGFFVEARLGKKRSPSADHWLTLGVLACAYVVTVLALASSQ